MKKKTVFFYISYIVVCIFLSIISAREPKDNLKTFQYGLSTDDTIELTEDKKVVSEFVLKDNVLQGISVKFQAEHKFQDELLHAALYDAETKELLAEDIVELKNERIQNKDTGSTVYFELPLEAQGQKKVYLEFSVEGDSIAVIPALVVSKSELEESSLQVNGKESEKNLVFFAYYNYGITYEVAESVGNGLLWILIGSVVFFFLVGAKKEQNRAEKHFWDRTERIGERIYSGLYRFRKVLGYGVLLMVLGVLFIYVYKFCIDEIVDSKKIKTIYKSSEIEDVVELDSDGIILEQSFTCTMDALSAIMFSIETQDVSAESQIEVYVIDETTGQILTTNEYNLEQTLSETEGGEIRIALDETLETADEHEICVRIVPDNLGTAQIRIKKDSESNICLKAEYGNVDFLKVVYLYICLFLFLAATLLYYLCFVKKAEIETIFVAAALSLGVIVSFTIGLNTVPDEPSHIDTAYSISNEIMGIQESKKPGYLYKRAEDVDMAAEEKQSLNVYHYERLYKQLFSMAEDTTLVECAGRNNLANANRLYYMPQAIGITLGRIFGFGMMPTMMLGRLLALICYTVLAYMALKKLPFAKVTLSLIGLLPISLQQAASFSYDGMINAVAFLYLSYCLSIIYGKNRIRYLDIAVIAVTGSMIATVKGGVYMPLCVVPLLVWSARKDLSVRTKKYVSAVVAVSIFSFMRGNLISTIQRFMREPGSATGGSASSQIYTFSDILENPVRFIGMFFNTFYKQGDSYLRNLLGGNLAWREVNISWFIIIGMLFILLLSCIVSNHEKVMAVRERIYLAMVSFGTFCCIELSMLLAWTPVTIKYITGVQGRYFIPFLLLVVLIMRGSLLRIKRNIDRELIFAAGMINVITVLQVLQRVLV